MCPRAVTMIARMRPWATATPSRSPPPVIIEPAPTKMSANAPTNSATDRRRPSPSTAGRLVPTPDGRAARSSTTCWSAYSSVSRPLRLVVDAHHIRDPVDVVEVGDHLERIVDRRVAPALRAHGIDVCAHDLRRLERHLDGEVAQAAHARLEVRLPVVVSGVLRQLVGCARGTEVVCVRANSVVAIVRARNDDRKQLALCPREL